MNIKILDSWLRDYLKTDAKPQQIADALSLSSVGIERVEKWNKDYLYDIEITTNRPDLASVVGIAREASAVLPQYGHTATFTPLPVPVIMRETKDLNKEDVSHQAQIDNVKLEIKNDPTLVNRICAVVLEVKRKKTPQVIRDRLESSDIRSLNNLIDVTNYVMRTIGFPTHIFDYDRLATKKLIIRESKPGETITTLDGKTYTLTGGDIIADDGNGNIVDLIGIMGLANSVVTDETTRIVFFINNDNPHKIRTTSMQLGIRTEAAQLNEKGLDPELTMTALQYGISLFKELADARILSDIFDIYPNKPKAKTVTVTKEDIAGVLGVAIPTDEAASILKKLDFSVTRQGDLITAQVPTFRLNDVSIREDLIEEIARIYGYQNIPNVLPPFISAETTHIEDDPFYWETRVKHALKYWGFTEVYTYPMVSEIMYEGDTAASVKLKNPLGEEFVYMRKTLVPSLLQVVDANKKTKAIRIFELGNVYVHHGKKLPIQSQHLGIVIRQPHASFFELKGVLEQLASDSGITDLTVKAIDKSGLETAIMLGKKQIGTIEVLDEDLLNMEIDFEEFIRHATMHKTFTPLQKYPPIIEDISVEVDDSVATGDLIDTIQQTSTVIAEVSLLDKYNASRTFHIHYQHTDRNITGKEVGEVREKILTRLKKQHDARIKS